MIDLKNIKPNIPKVALEDYVWIIAGTPKSGKTTLFAQLTEKYFGDINKSILLAFEKGYQALRVNAVDINTWSDFEEAVDQLVEQKDELPFKFIGIDTADVMWEMAQEEVIKEWNLKNPHKRTNDIAGVGARGKSDQGFGVGYQRAKQKIRKNIDKLVKAGYGLMVITHCKDKEIEQKNGLTYDQLVVSLPSSAREVFVNMADFIVFITIEKEKDGNNLESKRYMYFRTDGYVEAGSRFRNVPERIEYDVDEFIRVFENAVRSEFSDEKELENARKEQAKQKEEEIKKFIEQEKAKPKAGDLIQEITGLIKSDDLANKRNDIKQKFNELFGSASGYRTCDDVELLQEALDYIKELISE